MTPSWKDSAFAQLQQDRTQIEKEVGSCLDWQPLPGKKAARILLETQINPRDESKRDEVKNWLYEQSVKFHQAFSIRVKALVPPSTNGSIGEDDRSDDE